MKLQTERRTEERFSTLHKKTVERKDPENNKLTFSLQTVRIKLSETWKKSIRIKTVGTLQNWNKEVKSWHVQLWCNLGWSWHCHWRWQGYQVQAQMQSPMLTNKSIKNEGPFEKMGFNGKTVWRFMTIKRTETLFSTFQKNPVEHKDPKSINWTWPS